MNGEDAHPTPRTPLQDASYHLLIAILSIVERPVMGYSVWTEKGQLLTVLVLLLVVSWIIKIQIPF